jgi:hypothetical protein
MSADGLGSSVDGGGWRADRRRIADDQSPGEYLAEMP